MRLDKETDNLDAASVRSRKSSRRNRSSSVSSHGSQKLFRFGRNRALSRSSHRTGPVSGSTSVISTESPQYDSESDSHSSDGESEEEVWLPDYADAGTDDSLKLSELDVLLENSDDENHQHDGSRFSHVQNDAADGEPSPSSTVTENPEDQVSQKLEPSSHAAELTAEEQARQRFSFFGSKRDHTIHAKELSSLVDEGSSFASLFDEKGGAWWLDCLSPNDAEMKILSRAFGIHPLTAEDIRTEDSREKFEMFGKYYFVVYNTFASNKESPEFLEPINFYIVVFAQGILSFHFEPVTHCRNVRRRVRQLRDFVEVTSDWICYALIDDITDSFAPQIHDVETETDYIEDHVYQTQNVENMSPLLQRLADTRKVTMSLIRLLSGKADVIRGFAKRCSEQVANAPSADISLYLGDIEDHIVTMFQNLVAYEKILGRIHVNYMAQLQVEFVNSSNRMSTVLSKAALIGTVLVPMNLVTGLFGMNVRVPGDQVESNLGWWFGVFGVLIVVVTTLAFGANLWVNRITSRSM